MQYLKFLSKNTRLTNYSVIPNDLFGLGISSTALILYAKFLNRSNLSISTGQVDNAGKVYIFYKIKDLAKELGRGLSYFIPYDKRNCSLKYYMFQNFNIRM